MGIKNIFQGRPVGNLVRPGFRGRWSGPHRKNGVDSVVEDRWPIVTSNDPYSLNIAKTFQSWMEKLGWKSTMFQQIHRAAGGLERHGW
mgnify:CR=1 FL=1